MQSTHNTLDLRLALILVGLLPLWGSGCGDDGSGDDDDDMMVGDDDDDDMMMGDDDDDDMDAGVDAGMDPDAGVDGGVDAGMDAGMDAGPTCDDLDPTAFASNVVIRQYRLGTFLELYNPTASDIVVDGWRICDRPDYRGISGTVPARGYLAIDVAGFGSGDDSEVGGELGLYTTNSFGSRAAMVDYVCWGDPGSSRKTVAETSGAGGALWSGDCGPEPIADAVTRRTTTDGTSADDYDFTSTPDPIDCP